MQFNHKKPLTIKEERITNHEVGERIYLLVNDPSPARAVLLGDSVGYQRRLLEDQH